MNFDRLVNQLRSDEGEVLHAYPDQFGYITIGIGTCIDRRKNCGITSEEAEYLLTNRLKITEAALSVSVSNWSTLSETRQIALIDMAYQMGVNGVMNFKNMMESIEKEDWQGAHDHALDSKWAKQTPARADRIASMLLEG